MSGSRGVRVIVYQDSGMWVAQCLEYDIGAQASNLDTLHVRLAVALEAERQMSLEASGQPFAGIGPAPQRFHEMWEQRSGEFRPSRPSKTSDISLDMALCA